MERVTPTFTEKALILGGFTTMALVDHFFGLLAVFSLITLFGVVWFFKIK